MKLIDVTNNIAIILFGIVAIRNWRKNKQSIRKGLGFTFHWWTFGDFFSGLLIAILLIFGYFLYLTISGSIQVLYFNIPTYKFLDVINFIFIDAAKEEFIYRSLILSGLVVFVNGAKWPAVFIEAFLFSVVHYFTATETHQFISILFGGLIYSVAFLGGQNFWLPLGLHIGYNLAIGDIFGLASSLGGESLFVIMVNNDLNIYQYNYIFILVRIVGIIIVLKYLQWRCKHQGNYLRLQFPISIYKNDPVNPYLEKYGINEKPQKT